MDSQFEPQEDEFSAGLFGFAVPVTGSSAVGRETLDELLTRFSEAHRAEPSLSVEDYARQYPHLADEIRETFPLVLALEEWKDDKEVECLRRNLRPDLPLQKVGRFEIVREIGRGGMGVVLEAVDPRNGQHVAVKLLPWRHGSSLGRWRQRFRKEAETVSRLNHRNIVPIRAFGEHDGYCYYVMKLVEGISLDKIIRSLAVSDSVNLDEIRNQHTTAESEKPGAATTENQEQNSPETGEETSKSPAFDRHEQLPEICRDSWRMFANIGYQVAQALHYAHGQGILHNDIKPANILLDRQGRVRVTDFGLAGPIEPESGEINAGLSGTLCYMGPERFSGACDVRSDLFSLGATLYELLTLTPAFAAEGRKELIEQIQQPEPQRPRKIHPGIPRDLETIVTTCLSKAPADRYQTAHHLLADLQRFLNGERIRARKRSFLRKLARRLRG